jgi:hypothetical protein
MEKTLSLGSAAIADLMFDSISVLSPAQQDLLFQTKKEQTFSALLASRLHKSQESKNLSSFVELKGVEKIVKSTDRASVKKNRNTHDVCLIDDDAVFHLLLENKVWYHFDGAKGRKNKKVNPDIEDQLVPDIKKLTLTALDQTKSPKCFVLVNLVTPSDPSKLPSTYFGDHNKAFKRAQEQIDVYRQDGVDGVKGILEKHSETLLPVSHVSSTNALGVNGSAFLDVFCAEIKIK